MRSWRWDPDDGISVFTGRSNQRSLSAILGQSEKVCKPEKTPSPQTKSAGIFNSDFSASRTVKNKCLLFQPPSLTAVVASYFVTAAGADKGTTYAFIYNYMSISQTEFPYISELNNNCVLVFLKYVILIF